MASCRSRLHGPRCLPVTCIRVCCTTGSGAADCHPHPIGPGRALLICPVRAVDFVTHGYIHQEPLYGDLRVSHIRLRHPVKCRRPVAAAAIVEPFPLESVEPVVSLAAAFHDVVHFPLAAGLRHGHIVLPLADACVSLVVVASGGASWAVRATVRSVGVDHILVRRLSGQKLMVLDDLRGAFVA